MEECDEFEESCSLPSLLAHSDKCGSCKVARKWILEHVGWFRMKGDQNFHLPSRVNAAGIERNDFRSILLFLSSRVSSPQSTVEYYARRNWTELYNTAAVLSLFTICHSE